MRGEGHFGKALDSALASGYSNDGCNVGVASGLGGRMVGTAVKKRGLCPPLVLRIWLPWEQLAPLANVCLSVEPSSAVMLYTETRVARL